MEQVLVALIESKYPLMTLAIIGFGLLLSYLIRRQKLSNEKYNLKRFYDCDKTQILDTGHKKNARLLQKFKNQHENVFEQLPKKNSTYKSSTMRIVHNTKKPLP